MRSTASAAPSTSTRRRSPPASPLWRIPRLARPRARTMRDGADAGRSELEPRIAFLRREAHDEDMPYSETSERDLRQFMAARPSLRKPNLYLVDNGNLRAVWKGASGEHLAMQFLGGGQIQF